MRQHRRVILITGVVAAFAQIAPAQSTNGGGVGGDSLNQPGSRAIGRLLAAPRLDPSTPGATRVAVHWRTFLPATETEPARDYRETLFLFGDFGVSEDTQALDENGSPMTVIVDGQLKNIVFGGAAYRWNPIFGEDREGFETYMESDASERLSELNTFGGLTVNGGGDIAQYVIEMFMIDLRPALADLGAPGLVLAATPDVPGASVDPAFWKDSTKNAKDLELIFIERSRHFIMDDAPEALDERVRGFVKKHE